MVHPQKIRYFFLGAVVLVFLSACSKSEGQSLQLYETAQFEEQQFNTKHAKRLYEEILKKYPASEVAGKAKRRLEVLKEESP